MPGHIKLGKPGEPDPDPMPYLVVSMEMKRDDMLRPYDPRKSVWVPNIETGGFVEALLVSDEGGKATVMVGHEVSYCWFVVVIVFVVVVLLIVVVFLIDVVFLIFVVAVEKLIMSTDN
jgi:hypothetical protein